MPADLPERLPLPRRRAGPFHRRLAWRRRSGLRAPGPKLRRGRSPRRRWPRRALIGAVTLVVVLIVAAVGTLVYARWRFDQVHRTHVSGLSKLESGAPFDLLLVGSLPTSVAGKHSSAGSVTEAVVVARINPSTRRVRLLSIPIDTYVNVLVNVTGVSGPRTIAAASEASPSVLVVAISQSLHIPVTYYVDVNFARLGHLVDAFGGVHLDFRFPVRDSFSGLDVSKTGCELLDGSQAVGLAESSHLYYFSAGNWRAESGTDATRFQRQDALLGAVASATKGILTNPIALNNVVSATSADLTIDGTLSESKALYLAELFRGLSGNELVAETLPTVAYTTRRGQAVASPAPSPDERVITRFLSFGSVQSLSTAGQSSKGATTVTTVPGAPKVTAHDVVANERLAPWNPTPC